MTSHVTLRNATQRYIESGSVQFGQVKSDVKCSEVEQGSVTLRPGTSRHFKKLHVTLRKVRFGSGQVRSSQVKSGQIRSSGYEWK